MAYQPKRPPLDPCPVETVVALVGGKWKARVLLELALAPARFGDLRRALPGVTQQVLSAQLHALVDDGIVTRSAARPVAQDGASYALSDAGVSLLPVLDAMAEWGEERMRRVGQSWRRPSHPVRRRLAAGR